MDGIVGDTTWNKLGLSYSVNIPKGIPNSKVPIYDRQGNIVGEREFDSNGNASKDTDFTDHGNPQKHPNVPHQHRWGNNGRGPAEPVEMTYNEIVLSGIIAGIMTYNYFSSALRRR